MVYVPVGADVTAKDVVADIRRTRLTLGVKGEPPVLDGELWKEIKADESGWVLDEEEGQRCIIATLIKRDIWIDYDYLLKEHERSDTAVTSRCFLDVSIAGQPAQRIVLGLYGKALPRTVANFRALCVGVAAAGAPGRRLCYRGCRFTRILPGRLVQTGDVTRGDGTGGESIYGPTFEDEGFSIRHSKPGIVSMTNAGPNTNSSQFFITLEAAPDLDGRYVAFGEVLEGYDIVETIGALGDPQFSGAPDKEVVIQDCRALPL